MSMLDDIEAKLAKKGKLHDMPFRHEEIAALVSYVRVAEQMYGEFYPIGHDDLAKKFIIARKALGLDP